jgi:alpha-1,3-mannosyl-glycoprotein beta-1,2-N-acetylglucosaminyltransferase
MSCIYITKVNRVIIVEEDLQIAPDFYEYFDATADLLAEDPNLLGISL